MQERVGLTRPWDKQGSEKPQKFQTQVAGGRGEAEMEGLTGSVSGTHSLPSPPTPEYMEYQLAFDSWPKRKRLLVLKTE